jgi:UDP-N-acetylmuramoyl-tripeptide--D-alanyl-D-alanine ligase
MNTRTIPCSINQAVDLLLTYIEAGASVCTDTRKLQAGELFFALRGQNFNGNLYAAQALEKAAAVAIVDELPDELASTSESILFVPDVLACLQHLAKAWRTRLGIPVLGLTGSNGKTTTKELLASILTEAGVAHYATPGNFNNHIGLPLTLLGILQNHQLAIVEMGDNHPGEIDELCRIAMPNLGLITNIGIDHIGHYASLTENAATKLELFDWLAQQPNVVIFRNAADPYLAAWQAPSPCTERRYGTAIDAVSIQNYQPAPPGCPQEVVLRIENESVPFATALLGLHNAQNICAAVCVGLHLGISIPVIQKAIQNYQPQRNRSQTVRKAGRVFWLDAYNANPSSMEVAVRAFLEAAVDEGTCGIVLGEMLELGDQSEYFHRRLGAFLRTFKPYRWVLIGPEMRFCYEELRETSRHHWFPDTVAARHWFGQHYTEAQTWMLKGSRGSALETLLEHLPDETPTQATDH